VWASERGAVSVGCGPLNGPVSGVAEVLDAEGKIEVDHVPVDLNLVTALQALNFAFEERYAVFKLSPTSEAHADRRQAVKMNWLAHCNMALETALLAAFEACLALPHMLVLDAVRKTFLQVASFQTIRPTHFLS